MNKDIEWLQKQKQFISARAIEINLKMPEATLSKAVNGSRNLPKKWDKDLNEFLTELKK